jgi:hypothetical protein
VKRSKDQAPTLTMVLGGVVGARKLSELGDRQFVERTLASRYSKAFPIPHGREHSRKMNLLRIKAGQPSGPSRSA